MKNLNLCLFTLICGFSLFAHNSSHANTISSIVQHQPNLKEIVPEDETDPDWRKLIGYFVGNAVFKDQKI